MEGATVINDHATYTPLDLFNFTKEGSLALSPRSGYFSTDNGHTSLGVFNNSALNGGDIADWASNVSPAQARTLGLPTATDPYAADAFAAFGYPGYNGDISTSDLKEMAALGYKVPVA